MISKKFFILSFILINLLFPSPIFQNSIHFSSFINQNLNSLDQVTANGNITEAENAIQSAYLKLLEAETLFIDITSFSSNLETAIQSLNLAIRLNDSESPNYTWVEGNATLAKNIANNVYYDLIQLINQTIIVNVVILILVITLIGTGIGLFCVLYFRRIRKKLKEDFLESSVFKKEDKK